jgi:copper chaperone CopZ
VAVRSALLKVPGVTRAQVSLESHEAIVTFDPRVVAVDALVTAVNEADGPLASRMYRARVKTGSTPASAR